MAKWTQRLQPPAGALPGNLVTKVGVGVIAVLVIGLVLSQSGGDAEVEDAVVGGADPGVAGRGVVDQIQARLTQLAERRQRDEAARMRLEAAVDPGAESPLSSPSGPVTPVGEAGTGAGALPTTGELDLREQLRLEAIERRTRSLRAPSVVQTVQRNAPRADNAQRSDTDAAVRPPQPPAMADGTTNDATVSVPASSDPAALAAQIQDANAALLAGLTRGEPAGATPAPRTVPGVTGPPVGATADPVVIQTPGDPPGWERITEGSVLSAVLVTQLDGDFTGPVLAQVAIPFYSADRQRILVPRGARLLGAAQAVAHQDQQRLAVGFHRLVWPDGRWVDLAFHGLNALGESALVDQVDRHYPSLFAAAGAVGVLAGLTLQGATPYAGGEAGFRAAAGQGFGQSATQILGRFLNRLPTVTIRAGHRLRVWLTSDVLIPRPLPHPERMVR